MSIRLTAAFLLTLTLAACAAPATIDAPARAAGPVGPAIALPPMKTFGAAVPGRAPVRSNTEIARDFLDLSFRMESGRVLPVLSRFEGPIRVRVEGAAPPSLAADLSALLTRLRAEAGINISFTQGDEAEITIQALPRATLQTAVPRAACFVVPRVSGWDEFRAARRTDAIDWATLTERTRASIFVPSDVAPQEIRDCLHEELAQALGPLNDLYRLPDSVFNDDNIHAVLTSFDMLILRTYYAPELRSGMNIDAVATQLPRLLARYNPAGQRPGVGPVAPTSREWITAIENALDPTPGQSRRRASAAQAVNIALAAGWSGPRLGFAYYALGRLEIGRDPGAAFQAFLTSAQAYGARPETRIHAAHVAVQVAAFALSAGNADETLQIVEAAIPEARAAQNAALLATLMMFRAEALELSGRAADADIVRRDALGWARYGFGSETEVRARLAEVRALNPSSGAI